MPTPGMTVDPARDASVRAVWDAVTRDPDLATEVRQLRAEIVALRDRLCPAESTTIITGREAVEAFRRLR